MRLVHSVTALGLIAAGAAQADVTVYLAEGAFLNAADIVSRETFDDVPDVHVEGTIEINRVEFMSRGRWDVPGGCSLDRNLGISTIAPRRISFVDRNGGPGTVSAFGMRISTFAVFPPADFVATVTTADGVDTRVPLRDVVSDNPVYRGFVATTSPIVSVIIKAIGDTQWNFCFDDVARSAIDPQ